MNKKRTRETKSFIRRTLSQIFTLLCVAVFIYSGYKLTTIFLEYYHNRQVLNDAQKIYYQSTSESEEITHNEEGEWKIRPQFEELRTINPDITGWISIEGTQVNYPIVQTDNNEYYLTRNYKKDNSIAGSIFMDYRNDIKTSPTNTIVYGHRMKDGSMFNGLKKFLNEDFFSQHRIIQLDTLYASYDVEVFAVYSTTTDFDYIQTHFNSEEEYRLFLQEIQQHSLYHPDVKVNTDDQILTLSTCDYLLDPDKGRLVVHAKLVKRGI
ncbi:class B sortase [Bacillus sp. FJAT-49711]|uniref:class B sortase n=1 Tax=Bacillus sp. FJAT-49711 TaxID=2833585 RepID=UPI001BCA17FA|nr:class B sortase [Bacillus sp. FJAT-49711]MBS4218508.1 class B sortase [Bacillus sp. FJAT-49711]